MWLYTASHAGDSQASYYKYTDIRKFTGYNGTHTWGMHTSQ